MKKKMEKSLADSDAALSSGGTDNNSKVLMDSLSDGNQQGVSGTADGESGGGKHDRQRLVLTLEKFHR